MEKWTKVVGFPNFEVSDEGRIRSVDRSHMRHGSLVRMKGQFLSGSVEFDGPRRRVRSVRVTLHKNGRAYYRRIHHLVLEAFIGPRPEGMEGCHNDGNPLNNCLANLRWDTHQSNQDDMKIHGTRVKPPVQFGEKHHRATIADADVEIIRAQPYKRGLYSELARKYSVAPITIRRIYKRASRTIACLT